MSMKDWAENEIKLACKRENPEWDGESFDYGCSCYQSALKAYKSLLDDEHSGFSFSMTRGVLERLMYNLPLSPITEEDFKDGMGTTYPEEDVEKNGIVSDKQCPRMYSLFQKVTKDGRKLYHDIDRIICYENGSEYGCHFGLVSNIVDEMYPITMPYWPSKEKYEVYFECFLADRKNGDYDTVGVFYLITPSKERVEVNRYWTERDGEFAEIGKAEYDELKSKAGKESGK